jgi:hypothetical protein
MQSTRRHATPKNQAFQAEEIRQKKYFCEKITFSIDFAIKILSRVNCWLLSNTPEFLGISSFYSGSSYVIFRAEKIRSYTQSQKDSRFVETSHKAYGFAGTLSIRCSPWAVRLVQPCTCAPALRPTKPPALREYPHCALPLILFVIGYKKSF